MIKKINKINNILSYSFFDWDILNHIEYKDAHGNLKYTNGDFAKSNVIFAENGNGKSNLITIFKVLNGDSSAKLEKHWDLPQETQELELENANKFGFNAHNWSTLSGYFKDKFLVFDKIFTDTYVHSTGLEPHNTAERKQNRGKQIIYLGNFEDYNKVINKIDKIRSEITMRNKIFKETETTIVKAILPDGFDINELELHRDLIAQETNVDVEERIKERDGIDQLIKKTQLAINNTKEIEKLARLSKLEDSFSEILVPKQDQDVVNKDDKNTINPVELLEFSVSKGIEEVLNKIESKKDFIRSGMELINDTTKDCPFCEQQIKSDDFINIIKGYKSVFDETFLKEERKLLDSLHVYLTALRHLLSTSDIKSNTDKLLNIKKYVQLEEELPTYDISSTDKTNIQAEIENVISKQKEALKPIHDNKYNDISQIAKKAGEFVLKYNKSIDLINSTLETLQKDSIDGKLATKKTELEEKLKAKEKEIFFIKSRPTLLHYLEALVQIKINQDVVDTLEEIYQKVKEQAVTEFDTFVKDYFAEIKEIVSKLSPSMDIFEITGDGTYSRTGKESAICGFKLTYNGEERTKSLSEGERQVLALAFFLAQLRKTSNKDKIIIFDDPISAFDAGKRKSTADVINQETKEFNQIFVFTCDTLFREFCLKEFPDRKFYYIFKTLRNSSIQYVPSNKETIYSSFEDDFRNIVSVNGTNENVVIYGQKLRFCLETKIKEEYFGYSQDNLSNMIEKVAEVGLEKFGNLINSKDSIISLYKYCNTGGIAHYPRYGSTSWNELKDKINQYLELNL